MNTHRAIRTTPKRSTTPAPPAGTAAGWMLLCTALGVCAVAGLILQWGSRTDATALPQTEATAVPVTAAPLPEVGRCWGCPGRAGRTSSAKATASAYRPAGIAGAV